MTKQQLRVSDYVNFPIICPICHANLEGDKVELVVGQSVKTLVFTDSDHELVYVRQNLVAIHCYEEISY